MSAASPWRIQWTEALSVGVPDIDAEHQHFFGLVNELNKAVRERRADILSLNKMLREILAVARAHFAHEEQLFAHHGYPGHEHHAEEHEALLKTLDTLLTGLRDDTPETEWIVAGLKIRDALVEHVFEEDMKYRGMTVSIV